MLMLSYSICFTNLERFVILVQFINAVYVIISFIFSSYTCITPFDIQQGCRGYGNSHGDLHTHGNGMGMGIEIPLPR